LKKDHFPTSSRQSKLFKAVSLLFLAVFAFFIIALIVTDIFQIDRKAMMTVLTASFIRQSVWISVWTSCAATLLSLLFAVPAGFALSRYRFFGRLFVDTIVDLPIVFPPFVIGLILLAFFRQTACGTFIERTLGMGFVFEPRGIVLCQFVVSAGFALRFAKVAFDAVDIRAEDIALTLGCSRWDSFRFVAFPQAANGIIAGGILTWARSFGLFGPLFVFVGFTRGRTEALSSTMYLEQAAGNTEVAFAAALLAVFIAFVSILTIRVVSRKAVDGL